MKRSFVSVLTGSILLLGMVHFRCAPAEPPQPGGWTAQDTEALYAGDLFFIDTADFRPLSTLKDLTRQGLAYRVRPPLPFRELDGPWQWALGDPANGLRVDYSHRPDLDSLVRLPHRVDRPDWPFWYERKLFLSSGSYLFADGDDGVQCFVDGQLQEPVMGNYFFIPAQADSVRVTLRVLNNAMAGGLRKVALIAPEAFHRFLEERDRWLLVRQLLYVAKQYAVRNDQAQWERLSQTLAGGDPDAMKALIATYPPLIWPHLRKNLPDTTEAGSFFAFTAWGDSQGGWRTFASLVRLMASGPGRFSIGLGDLVANGVDEHQWLSFTQCLQPLLEKQPVFSVAGNHDYDGYYNSLDPLLYRKYVLADTLRPTFFSWRYGGAYFLTLDPNGSFPLGIDDAQRAWMEEEMNSPEWEAADWRFLLIHQPPYSQGWPGYHGDAFMRRIVDSLAAPERIDFVLSGHSHDYERQNKVYGRQRTHFFVLGGAGGGLEPPESSDLPKMDTVIKAHHYAQFKVGSGQVSVTAFGRDGRVLDTLLVTKTGPF